MNAINRKLMMCTDTVNTVSFERKKWTNTLIALVFAIVFSAFLTSCKGGEEDTDEKIKAKLEANRLRYGDPDVIIKDKDGNPIPGFDGGVLRASDVPTNPNLEFPVLETIASMAKTLGLPTPAEGQILYGISYEGNLELLKLNELFYNFHEEKGTLSAMNFIFNNISNKNFSDEYLFNNGTWVDGRPGLFIQRNNENPREYEQQRPARVYINTSNGVEIFAYGSEKLIARLAAGDEPNTVKKTTYNEDGTIKNEETIPVEFIIIDQPKDEPN